MEIVSNSSQPYLLSISDNTKVFLNHQKFTLGRGLGNSYVVEDLQISRTHCIFEEINGIWLLTDQSSNGTLVNKHRIPTKTPQILSDGDTIQLTDNHEYVFVNIQKDSLEDIDLAAIIDEAEIKCTDREVEITSSDINDMIGASANNVDLLDTAASTSSKDEPCQKTNNEESSNSESANDVNVFDKIFGHTDAACASTVDTQPVMEEELNKAISPVKPNNSTLAQVENELQCIICTELFIKATTLNCSHSFCKYCLEEWRKKNRKCPICRTRITTVTPTLVLDNFIAKVMESASDDVKQAREEVIKGREKTETVSSFATKTEKVLRSRTVTPIEISSEETTDDEDEDYAYYDSDELTYNGVPGAYYGGYGHCYNCGERGHWSNGCPYH